MAIFHIKIELASGKRYAEFREVPDAELEEYYTETYANAIKILGAGLVDFQLTQISMQSKEAQRLRRHKTQERTQKRKRRRRPIQTVGSKKSRIAA